MKFWRKCTRASRGPAVVRARRTFIANETEQVVLTGSKHLFSSKDREQIEIHAGTFGLWHSTGEIQFLRSSPQLLALTKEIERGLQSAETLLNSHKELRFPIHTLGVAHFFFEVDHLEYLA